jgi:ABC-type amino acid transport system permease subunit
MIENLLFGLPGERPGGLLLTLLYTIGAGLGALAAGFVYAGLCVHFPRTSLLMQTATAFVRGVPLLLLVFFLAEGITTSLTVAGLLALLLYSFVYVGEILRTFLASYPQRLADQARVAGVHPVTEWLVFRLPWTFGKSFGALVTHWISLLKDTGALVVLSIGELTTVAKALSESSSEPNAWMMTIGTAGALYLGATLCLIAGLSAIRRRLHLDRHLSYA